MIKNIVLIIFLLASCFAIKAEEIIYLNRSPRALLMGDAYTSIAEDSYTLFYNPAGLGRNKGVYFNMLNPDFHLTNALDEVDRFNDFPSSDATAISERLIGFPLYFKMGISPTLKMHTFGFSPIINFNWKMELQNRIHPTFGIDYRYDRGFVMGYAYAFGGGGRDPITAKMNPGSKTSLGLSIKHLRREGLKGYFDLYGTTLLSKIQSGVESASDIRDAFGFAEGKGWGLDVGFQQIWSTAYSELSFGGAVMDVGGTKFRKIAGTRDVPEQEMIVSLGAGWRQDFTIVNYSLTFDLRPLNEAIDFGRKVHVGAKVGIPTLDFFAGWNEGYFGYGVEWKFWPVTLTAGFYSVELGHTYKQYEGKRALLQLQFFDVDLDF